MSERYCPAWGPGSAVCPRDMCDCFIDQFPNDMEQAGGVHPEFYRVVGPVQQEGDSGDGAGNPWV